MSSFYPNSTLPGFPPPETIERNGPLLDQHAAEEPSLAVLQGESAAVRHVRSQVERIAPYFRSALVRGERGTGKRLVALALHRLGPGNGAPFVAVSAPDFTRILEDAARTRALLDSARGGSLYLENVSELSVAAQADLLRLLTAREAQRTAGTQRPTANRPEPRAGEVRIIASTHRDLRAMANVGQFRHELYTRLAVIEIVAPSLAQRTEDIPVLARWLLDRQSRENSAPRRSLSPAALTALAERTWPRNLRDLEQTLTRAAAVAAGRLIEPEDLPHTIHPAPQPAPAPAAVAPSLGDRLEDVIQHHVLNVLARCGGNKLRAAELLGISRSTLYRMLESGNAAPHANGAA